MTDFNCQNSAIFFYGRQNSKMSLKIHFLTIQSNNNPRNAVKSSNFVTGTEATNQLTLK